LYMPVEAFFLTFNLFGPHSNKQVDLGFYLMVLFVLAYVALMIVEILRRRRLKKLKPTEDLYSSTDLLDDF